MDLLWRMLGLGAAGYGAYRTGAAGAVGRAFKNVWGAGGMGRTALSRLGTGEFRAAGQGLAQSSGAMRLAAGLRGAYRTGGIAGRAQAISTLKQYGPRLAANTAVIGIPAMGIATSGARMMGGRAPWRDRYGRSDLPGVPLI